MHPDLHWFFPRPRLKDGDATADDVKGDLGEAITERMEADGLWAPPPGTDGLYVATVRALVHLASLRPAMAARAVFVVGDAERMVSQEGADQAANAFLKLLEEPPNGTTLILTTSEPGALLPTIKSRVVSVRVPPLARADMDAFLDDAAVSRTLARVTREEALARANGAPGELFAGESMAAAFGSARKLLDAALAPNTPDGMAERVKAAARQGVAGARGSFSDTLDALTHLLHARTQQLVHAGRESDARRTASALVHVETAKTKAQGNVSPQLLSAALVSTLHRTLHP
jgi:DNA polymerase-3 subunit delta'